MDKNLNIEIDIKKPTKEELESIIVPLIPEPIKGEKGDKGKDGRDGKDGKDAKPPTKKELKEIIKPLIPKPIKGKDGKDGRDGKDGKDGVSPNIDDIKKEIGTIEIEYNQIVNAPQVEQIIRKTSVASKTHSFLELEDTPKTYVGQAGKVAKVNPTETALIFGDATDTDEKTKVSANDTTAGYLNGKLVAGTGITFTENNNGGNETLTIESTATGGDPAGSDTQVQFNDAGAFGADTGFVYKKVGKKFGVNKATPLATGDFGAESYTIGNPSSLSFTYDELYSGGLAFEVAYAYSVYGKRTITKADTTTEDIFSATPATATATSYSIRPTASGVANYANPGYVANGTDFNFTVYPLYETDTIIGAGRQYTVGQDGSGYNYGIDHTISSPTWGTPSNYLIMKDNDNTYQIVAGSFADDNSAWLADATTQINTYTQITGLQINLSWSSATNAEDYRIRNTTSTKWTDKGSTTTSISDIGTWTAGTPTTTPSSTVDIGLSTDGDAKLKAGINHSGTKAGFYNATPITKPTGDVATALGNLGLVGSPTYSASSLAGTAYRIPFFDASGVGSSDADFLFRNGGVGYGFANAGLADSGINTDSFNIGSQMNFKMKTISGVAGNKHNVDVTNKTHIYSNAAGTTTFSGFAGGYDGKILFVTNGQSGTIGFLNNSSSSSAGNRLMLGTGNAPTTLTGLGPRTYMFIYDATNSFWKLIGGDRETVLTSNNSWTGINDFTGTARFGATFRLKYEDKTANYSMVASDIGIVATSGTFNVTLESATLEVIHYIKNVGTGVITINTTSSQTIDGLASGAIKLNQYDSIGVTGTSGSGWRILWLHRHAQTQGLLSGTYTPTLTGVANVTSTTARQATYMRVGNTVTVSGQMDITPTGSGIVSVGISLPIASNFTTAYQGAGTGHCAAAVTGHGMFIQSDATNDRVQADYYDAVGSSDTFSYTFTYQIL